MKVMPLRLPPLPAKNITISIKPPSQTPSNTRGRKYSVHHLETNDQSESSGPSSSTKIPLQATVNRRATDSCKSIRIKQTSVPSRKIRKAATHMEQYTFSDLPPSVTAKSWILYEMKQGRTIYSKRSKKQREMASLTKIMNLITILELLEKAELNAKTIRARATKVASSLEGTTANLKHQVEYCLEDLFYGMMLPSGNDAAFLVAELGGLISQKKSIPTNVDQLSETLECRNGGFVNSYLREMNNLAHKIGLSNSIFANVNGLNNTQNISTAEDLAKLCSYAMRNRKFRKIVQTQKYHYWYTEYEQPVEEEEQAEEKVCKPQKISEKIEGIWQNTNKMLGQGWSGIKTGITPNAGPCLAASLHKTFSGKQYEFLVVLLDSQSMQSRWQEVQKLVEWAILTRQYI